LRAAVPFDDLAHDEQPQSHPAARAFGREIRVEHLPDVFGWNAAAVIGHAQAGAVAVPFHDQPDQPTGWRQRLDGVLHNIGDCARELNGIADDRHNAFFLLAHDAGMHRLRHRLAGERHLARQSVEIDQRQMTTGILANQALPGIQQFAAAPYGAVQPAQVLDRFQGRFGDRALPVGQFVAQQFGGAGDDGERIADVMHELR